MSYEALRMIYWFILQCGVLGFVLCEGLNLGVGMLMPLAGKTAIEKERFLAVIAPTSFGQLAWLPATLAILFAAWPVAYAVLFSSLPWLLPILLIAWLIRPFGLLYHHAVEIPRWRQNWLQALTISSFAITTILGVVAGNLLKGIPFHLDSDMRIFFLGDVWGLLNPFALLIAAMATALFIMYAASFLQLHIGGDAALACRQWVFKAGMAFLLLFALAGLWLLHLEGYHITTEVLANADSNPLSKFVKRNEGLWLDNYEHAPCLWALPTLVATTTALCMYFNQCRRHYWALLAAVVAVAFCVLTLAATMFPFLLPSNRSLNTSLTVWDASAGRYTLASLLWVMGPALPLMGVLSRYAFYECGKKSESGDRGKANGW